MRLVEFDLALLDVVTLNFKLMCNVGRGDGAEQFAFFANSRRKRHGHFREFFSD